MIRKTLVSLLLLLVATPATAWWHCDWDYRFPVTVNAPPGPPLTEYQVRLDLNSLNVPAQFDWNTLGDDLRLIAQDDTTALDYFIEQWDATGMTAIIWVRVPSISIAGVTVYVYFGAPPGTPSTSTPLTFTESGLKWHTRNSAADPINRATAEAAFAVASPNVPGYGCTLISSYTGITNVGIFGPPNRNDDIGLFAEVFFEVTPAQAGVWQFRYGADFGRGGGLYIDDAALDEKWNVDLWWDNDWNNTSQLLQGSVNLAAGTHSLRILGFEGCCDGGLTAQFQRPGGPWLALALSNIALSSRKCPVTEPSVAFGPVQTGSCPAIVITRSTQVISDPVNIASNPKAIPGALTLNVTNIRNTASGAADAASVVISEAIPPDMALLVVDFDGLTSGPVQFNDGSPSSGLSYTFTSLGDTGDDVSFSDNNGATYNYTPTADANGTDVAVTNIRINPKNAFAGNSGAGDPQADFAFKMRVR